MPVNWNDFHFIRPEYLWLLLPLVFLLYKASQNAKKQSSWHKIISPHLLNYLLMSGESKKNKNGFWLTGTIATLMIIAISGPSIRQNTVPVFQTEQAQVILLDLSLSMDATDIKPSRLERAKFKLLDLLEQTNEGTIALVVYAGDAFVISPLTSDAKTIANMVPTLSTSIMPVLGSRPDLAIKKSVDLLKNAKYSNGQIIWLTDGVDEKFTNTISQVINDTHFNLSILAVGTEQGAPIPLPDKSGFLKDASGKIVVPKLQTTELKEIATQSNAGIVQLTADNKDIEYLKKIHQLNSDDKQNTDNQQQINKWIDDGYWLIWLIIIFFFIQLIKYPTSQTNSLMSSAMVMIIFSSFFTSPVKAISWQDLWLTKNQQAESAYQKGEFSQAAKLYENQQWKAAAQYKNGDFTDAANNFLTEKSNQSLYNHATSLAKSNQLQPALDAYNKLLEKEPNHEDAQFNKKIIEDLLKQQQEQQNADQENQEQQNQDSESDSESESNSEQQQKNDENSEQQQEQQEQQNSEEPSEQQAPKQPVEMSKDEREQSEKDQALEHWLEKIPDDPGGLLRRKMYREYQRRGRQQKEEKLW